MDRWNRVLAAFGTIQHTDPMTAQEAQTYADKGWQRWVPVTAALVELEKAATQPQPTDPEPQPTEETDPQVDQTVIDTVTDWRDEQAAGTQHYERWDRVLAAFGTVDRTDAMTAQEAQTYADKGWQRWVQIVDILEDIESAAQQQQQGTALENPQYVPQQDQLPSTQQDQQVCSGNEFNPPRACKDYLTGRFNDVRDRVTSIINDMEQVVAEAEARQSEDPARYTELVNQWNRYKSMSYVGIDARLNNIKYVESNIANGYWDDIIGTVKKLEYAMTYFPGWLSTLQSKLAEFSSYGPLESCPQIDPTTNKALVRYIEAEKVHSKTIPGDRDDIPADGTFVTATDTHVTYTYTDGTIAHNLTERICAYHDLDYGENHKRLVAEAMLALGIYPEALGVTPMSADKAYELEKKYDNSRYGFTGDFMYPVWQESIWKEIATEIQQRESDNYYEENKDRIESSHMTQKEMCAQPLVYCEYSTGPSPENSAITETWISKVISFRSIDSILENLDSTFSSADKETTYDDQGDITDVKYYVDQELLFHHNHTSNGQTVYHLTSGEKVWELKSDVHGISAINMWYHKAPFNKFLDIAQINNGVPDLVTIRYTDTNGVMYTKVYNTCREGDGTPTTCTSLLTQFDYTKFLKPQIIAQEARYGQDGKPTTIILYDYSGVPIDTHMID